MDILDVISWILGVVGTFCILAAFIGALMCVAEPSKEHDGFAKNFTGPL